MPRIRTRLKLPIPIKVGADIDALLTLNLEHRVIFVYGHRHAYRR
jgi:hypothetical protein